MPLHPCHAPAAPLSETVLQQAGTLGLVRAFPAAVCMSYRWGLLSPYGAKSGGRTVDIDRCAST